MKKFYTIYCCLDDEFGGNQRYWKQANREFYSSELLREIMALYDDGPGPTPPDGEVRDIRSIRVCDGGDFAVLEWSRAHGFRAPVVAGEYSDDPSGRAAAVDAKMPKIKLNEKTVECRDCLALVPATDGRCGYCGWTVPGALSK